jgi:hypothetical protein
MTMKKALGAVVALILLGGFSSYLFVQARHIGYNQGYEPTQPIPFSHKIHAGDNQIECMYCHYGADQSRHASIPPTEFCLNCHKQVKTNSPHIKKIAKAVESGENIKWVKVNHLPDFAYFNHAQHVNVAEIDCQKCHGPVDEMDVYYQHGKLNMGWCIECHRDNGIAPPDDHKRAAGGDCSKCHY